MPREPRDAVLNVRVPEAVKEALGRVADEQQRSVSSLTVIALTDWLTERGHLKPSKSSTSSRRK
jgi:predicted HicB family RNase H-like nuclease